MCNDAFTVRDLDITMKPAAVILELQHYDDDTLADTETTFEYSFPVIIPICCIEHTKAAIEAVSKLLNLTYTDRIRIHNFVYVFLEHTKNQTEKEDRDLFFVTDDGYWYCSNYTTRILYDLAHSCPCSAPLLSA